MTDIPAHVVRVHDGDTFTVEVVVRLRNANARELSEPGGVEARDNLRAILEANPQVVLVNPAEDRYPGRVDADVAVAGTDLVGFLVARGWLARYPGHGPKVNPPWPRET